MSMRVYSVERNGDVEVEMASFGVVDPESVEQNEGLLESGARRERSA